MSTTTPCPTCGTPMIRSLYGLREWICPADTSHSGQALAEAPATEHYHTDEEHHGVCPTCEKPYTIWHGGPKGIWRDCPDEYHNGHDGEGETPAAPQPLNNLDELVDEIVPHRHAECGANGCELPQLQFKAKQAIQRLITAAEIKTKVELTKELRAIYNAPSRDGGKMFDFASLLDNQIEAFEAELKEAK